MDAANGSSNAFAISGGELPAVLTAGPVTPWKGDVATVAAGLIGPLVLRFTGRALWTAGVGAYFIERHVGT